MSSTKRYIEVLKRSAEVVEAYRRSLSRHLVAIRDLARERFGPGVRVYLFGSTLRGDHGPLSDIDVAVVLDREPTESERAAFRAELRERLGLFHPFEVHVVSEESWRGWYLRFVKGECREV